ncbi:SURF4 family protein [Collimonas fungivorans]|uniref:SURF4 family protein n=1 Tax=Collimonas fungivorans TaxID=158899 RepID=A0A127P5H3_9BURK|nr:SURF4 family protein [Collimonas fungivorans]
MRRAYRHGIELLNHRILKIMQTSPALYRIGRTLLASLFVVSGVLKITAFSSVVAYMDRIGVPFATIAVLASILVEAGGGLAILSGWQVRPVAVVVAIFTVIATLTAHRFWQAEPAGMQNQLNHFLKNIAIIGALLMLAAMDDSYIKNKITASTNLK